MNDIYTILENIVIFLSRDVVYKIVLPLIFIFLVFDIFRYLFSRDSKKEEIIDALKNKATGFVVLVFLPFIMLWFINFLGKVTNANIDVDTSILEKLTGEKPNVGPSKAPSVH